MKKLLALLMALCLIPLSAFSGALAEEEDDLIIEDTVEEFPPEKESGEVDSTEGGAETDAQANPDDTFVDEETGEVFVLTTEEQEKLDSLLEDQPEEEEGIDPDSLDLNPTCRTT